MKKSLVLFLLLVFGLFASAQSIVVRSGLHQEIYQIPINHGMITHTKTITAAPIDVLFSFALNSKVDLVTGVKFVPYENRVKILPPNADIYFGSGYWLYSTLGIPVICNTKFPIGEKFHFYVSTGLVPSMVFRRNDLTFTFAQSKSYIITEEQRYPSNKFNLLVNSGLGMRYSFKYFEIGMLAEYYAGLFKTYTSEINVIGSAAGDGAYYYQVSSKGDYWALNLEIIYPFSFGKQ